jgi:putative two-component system response regulator
MITLEQISKARILIIDDQKLHSFFLEKLLKQEGYQEILCVIEPLKALASVREFKPDLLVLDLIMPQINGFQIMEQLNDFRKDHYLPILALSEDRGSEMRLHALQSGATDYLNKPYENVEILFRIRNMIEMRILNMAVEGQNKILETKVQERTKELRDTQFEVIRRLAQAAEFRDNDTGIHIIRMSHFCAKFGETVGLNETECDLLLSASPLHDVGKIGIPDNILLKPGPLTESEWEIMKTHTSMGAQLLSGSNSPVMKMAQVIALTHHEKWDGTGYPQKLNGDQIPLVGQICSICDVFDALTSHRPYKKAWTPDDALQEIVKQKSRQFNAKMVDAFTKVFPEIIKIREKYSDEIQKVG